MLLRSRRMLPSAETRRTTIPPDTSMSSQMPSKSSIAFLLSDFDQEPGDDEEACPSVCDHTEKVRDDVVDDDVNQPSIEENRVENTSILRQRRTKRQRKFIPSNIDSTITISVNTIHPQHKRTQSCSLHRRDGLHTTKKRRTIKSSMTRLSTEMDVTETTRCLTSSQILPHCLQSVFTSDDHVSDSNWLSSPLIDLVLWQLASRYPQVQFLSTDFSHYYLESVLQRHLMKKSGRKPLTRSDFRISDVLGCAVHYTGKRRDQKPLVFIANINHIHWNLFRVQFVPKPELQLFEPMGRLSSRSGLSYRAVPRSITTWLDACFPLTSKSWRNCAVSAITTRQQVSGFDCGVACLLYAEKCGQGLPHEQIHTETTQSTITAFRTTLQDWVTLD